MLHSTETAIAGVVSDVFNVVDRKLPNVLLLLDIDIGAAFDSLDHKPLLRANELFSFNGMAWDKLRSYLSGREQFAELSGRQSLSVKLSIAVPQELVFGPLMFSIFMTPVRRRISILGSSSHQFTDYTQLYAAIKSSSSSSLAELSFIADAVTG